MWCAAVCGGSCGQKRSPPFAGNGFPAWTGSIFMPLSACIVTLTAELGKYVLRHPRLRNWGTVNKEVRKDFLHNLRIFCVVFAPFHLLSGTLWTYCLHILHAALWLKMWSKKTPALYRLQLSIKGGRYFLSLLLVWITNKRGTGKLFWLCSQLKI